MSSNAKKSLLDSPQSNKIFPITVLVSYLSAILPAKWLSGSSGFASNVLRHGIYHILSVLSGNRPDATQNDPRKLIALLTAIYLGSVYILSSTLSTTGQLLGNKSGYQNREPRARKRNITSGLPHRMIAAHEALLDIFPAFAVSAGLVACSLPVGDFNAEPALNALTMHVFMKLFIYVPAYLLDIDLVRTSSHMLSIGFLLVALWSIVVPQ